MGFVIGALGWEYDSWQGAYYPDDLPVDWRLGYYANDFFSVMLPYDMWSNTALEVIADWQDEVHGQFRFFPQVKEPETTEEAVELRSRLNALSPVLGGLLCDAPVGSAWLEEPVMGPEGSVRCFWPVPPSALPDEPLIHRCWRSGSDAGEGSRIVLLDSRAAGDLRSIRLLLEGLAQGGAETKAPWGVFLQGSPPDTALMQEIKTMSQLMGFA